MIFKTEKEVTMKRAFDAKRHRVRIKRKKQEKMIIWIAAVLSFTLFLMIVYCSDNTGKSSIDSQ